MVFQNIASAVATEIDPKIFPKDTVSPEPPARLRLVPKFKSGSISMKITIRFSVTFIHCGDFHEKCTHSPCQFS